MRRQLLQLLALLQHVGVEHIITVLQCQTEPGMLEVTKPLISWI